jgi:hypothetical protein
MPFDHPFYLGLTVVVFLAFGLIVAYVDRIASKRLNWTAIPPNDRYVGFLS